VVTALVTQTSPAKEIIVVHSGPNDPSERIGHLCSNLRIAHEDRRIFAGAARNIGAEYAESKWIAFIDSDVLPDPSWLASLLDAANEAPNRFVVGSVGYTQAGGYWGLVLWATEFSGIHPYIPDGEVQGGASANMLVPRDAFRQVSGFNERFTASEDSLLAADLRELGLTNWFCAAARGGHFNVKGMRHCLGHLHWLGYWGALCRRVRPLRGALAIKFWPFAAGLWAAKFFLTYYRVFRWGRGSRLRFLALAPGVLLGQFAWNIGFLSGLFRPGNTSTEGHD
jgi:GT2 family glycosyltransferase